jgi:hypothetical protein
MASFGQFWRGDVSRGLFVRGEVCLGKSSSGALCCGMSRPVEAWRGYSRLGFLILGNASKAKKK